MVGSPPLPMMRSCISTAVVTFTISAYDSLTFFGLTAKQLLLSTDISGGDPKFEAITMLLQLG